MGSVSFGGIYSVDLSTVYTMLDRSETYADSEIQLSNALKAILLDMVTTAGSTIRKKCLC